ncbi:uncharacterized protein BP5553_04356 [Venustampulla echinocandica]|uniref:Uncharacterized protein n=1 Tax=Venustampulla echinocandica TaxID=2656787 RepID=A0A370TWV7_9HELO|nr:uncharacterized protein BP5553_04356 [Venustampulla echinocandica]RDL40016.1 hypothetical protein BP5553_04356 [Venustampulla echinocandica]
MWLINRKRNKTSSSPGPRRGVLRRWVLSPRQENRAPAPAPECRSADFLLPAPAIPLAVDPETPNRGLKSAPRPKEHRSERPPRPQNDPDMEFVRVQANMALLKLDLENSASKVHAEMLTRGTIGRNPEGKIAPEHLNSGIFHWQHFVKTCGNTNRLAQKPEPFFQYKLKNLGLKELFELDYELHSFANELDVLTQWWETDYREWVIHDMEIQTLERALLLLSAKKKKSQAYLARTGLPLARRKAKEAGLVKAVDEYKLQVAQLQEENRWFEENSKLTSVVVSQFNKLRVGAEAAKSRRKQREVLPVDFTYDWDGIDLPSVDHIPSWWKSESPRWWLTHAIKDIEMRWHELDASLEVCEIEFEQCVTLRNETRCHLELLLARSNMEKENKDRESKQVNELDREVLLLQNLVRAWNQELKLRDGKGIELRKRHKRTTSLLAFAKDNSHHAQLMESDWATMGGIPKDDAFHYVYVYTIISLQAFRSDMLEQLQEALDRKDFPHDAKLWILGRIRSHTEAFTDSQKWVCELPHTDILRYTDIVENAIIRLAEEWDSLYKIVGDAEECLKIAEEFIASPFQPLTMAGDINFDAGELSSPVVGSSRSLGNAQPAHNYQDVLNEIDNRGTSKGGTLGESIHGFFVSPDIASTFQSMSDTLLDGFIQLVNSLISTEYHFTSREIVAFLNHCTTLQELFKLDGKTVSALEDGWELVDEMPIAGPPRNITPLSPLAYEFGRFLARNQDALLKGVGLPINGPHRDVWQDDVVAVLRRHCPYSLRHDSRHGLSDDAILNLLDATRAQGKFFRCSTPGQPILRRIDNGWHIDPASELPQLFAEQNAEKEYFKPLRQLFRSFTFRQAFKDAESNKIPVDNVGSLYEYFEDWLYIHQGTSRTFEQGWESKEDFDGVEYDDEMNFGACFVVVEPQGPWPFVKVWLGSFKLLFHELCCNTWGESGFAATALGDLRPDPATSAPCYQRSPNDQPELPLSPAVPETMTSKSVRSLHESTGMHFSPAGLAAIRDVYVCAIA